jgi:D-alanyl-D-alanine carboxypeptidase/D-alanyl-D-alanine-endopeptidase (penicillin-binding protein 4)
MKSESNIIVVIKRLPLYPIFFVFFMPMLAAQPASFNKLLATPSMEGASLSFSLVDANSGEVKFTHNEYLALVPASVLKLVTSATALEILGGEHIFATSLYYSGRLDKNSGMLDGDIIISGGGDPTLGSERFAEHYGDLLDKWATSIKESGIRSINGRVVADDGYFDYDPIPGEWLWEDIGNYYGAGVYGLSIFDNTYKIHFKTSYEGSVPVMTSISREGSGIELENRLTAKGSVDLGYIFATPYSSSGWISGTIPANRTDFVLKGAITDPPLLAARMLEERLEAININVANGATTARISGKFDSGHYMSINETVSPPLKEIIYVLNHESINLYAETLVKEMAKYRGLEGTRTNGIKVIENYLAEKEIWNDNTRLIDGSGLSPQNKISALALTSLLVKMKGSRSGEEFVRSLPSPGEEGTIKNIFLDQIFRDNLRIKSGSMDGVRSFAGYFTAISGKELAFAIIVNNFSGPSSQLISAIEEVIKECALNY